MNAWWKAEELEFGLNDSEAKVLICDARRLSVIADRLDAIPTVEHVFVIGELPDDVLAPVPARIAVRPFA